MGKQLNRDRIVAEARIVLTESGSETVSLRVVASRLGVTAPALYRHVAGRDQLMREIADRELDGLIAQMPTQAGDPVAALRQFCHAYVDYALANPRLYRTVFRNPPWRTVFDEEGMPAADAVPPARFAVQYDACAAAIDAGAFAPMRAADALLMLFTAVHGLVEVFLLDLVPDGEDGRRHFADNLVETVFAGLARRAS